MQTSSAHLKPHVITEAQRLSMILHMEGMPDELPLLSDQDNFEALSDHIEPQSAHESVLYAYGLNEATEVDTFIEVQQRVQNFASL